MIKKKAAKPKARQAAKPEKPKDLGTLGTAQIKIHKLEKKNVSYRIGC